MKKLLFLLLLIPFLGTSQGTFTAPVGYNTGAPTAAPSGVGTRWRFDLLTGKKYTWNPDAVAWDEDPRGIDQISGCSAPMYTPGYNQSTFAVNSCSTPELYQYYSSAWHCLNCGGGTNISAGSGITLSGTAPDITISADDNSPTNELQTLSIDGNDLTLSDGGGTVTLPGGGGSSLGTGFTNGGGSGTIPSATTLDGNGNDLTMNNFASLILGSSYMSLTADEGYFAGGYFGFNADYWESNAQTVNFSISDGLGIRYTADNSATIAANPSSIPDVRAVNLLKQTPISYTNAAAPNNTIFYSTTDSKLSYKDPGGVVHGLY